MFKSIDIIIGIGGAKMDFIVGWLGSTEEYNINDWEIHSNGKSHYKYAYSYKKLDCDKNLTIKDITKKIYYNQPSGVYLKYLKLDKRIACGIHGKNILNQLDSDYNYRLFLIVVNDSCFDEVLINGIHKNNLDTNVVQERLAYKYHWHPEYEELCRKLKPTILKYDKFNCIGGSRYIQEKFNINVTENDHNYWNTQLPKSFIK